MSLKINLLEWAVETFGENDLDDLASIREETLPTKDPKQQIKKVVLFVKKRIGIKKDWLKKETIDAWTAVLKEKIGEHLKFDMRSVEGHEFQALSGVQGNPDGKEHYITRPSHELYNYQFNLEIVKRISIKEKSNVGAKPRIPKGEAV